MFLSETFSFLFFYYKNTMTTSTVLCQCIDSLYNMNGFIHHRFCTIRPNVNTVKKVNHILVL